MKHLSTTFLAFFLLCLALSPAAAQDDKSSVGQKIDGFSLQDYRGKTWTLDQFKDSKLVVVAFLGTDCPLAKFYGPRLEQIAKEYSAKSVAFVGIDANAQDSVTEIAAYARIHGIEYPILRDGGNKVADRMKATRTPEVFVLDAGRTIRYQGRVDDQYGIGYIRDKAEQHDLKQALDELLAGKQVSQSFAKAVGCIIGRAREAKDNTTVTYSKHIAPILQNRCLECHRDGEIAPFALTDYKEVAGWSEMIAEVIFEGRMPPWHANPAHGKFSNDRHLTQEEKDLIAQWVKNGAPEGNPADLPPAKKYVTGWQLPREPDAVVNMSSKPYRVQATGTVKYQTFKVDSNFTEDKWVSAAQIVPGNRAVVHHVLVFAAPKNGAELIGAIIDGQQGFLAGYVPGQRVYAFPAGMAKRVPAGSQLWFQIHYTPIGTEQTDLTKIGFVFADPKTITHEVKTRSAKVSPGNLRIPPEDANHKVEATTINTFPNGLLLGFMPHMHLRGKSFSYEATYPDNTKEMLLDVPGYDFNWQTNYRLAEPKTLPKGTRIHCVAHFDNSEDNLNNPNPKVEVRWGSQTWNEMMIGYYDVAFPISEEDKKPAVIPPAPVEKGGPTDAEQGQKLFRLLDKNGDGKIVREELTPNLQKRFTEFDRDGSGGVTLQELAAGMNQTKKPG